MVVVYLITPNPVEVLINAKQICNVLIQKEFFLIHVLNSAQIAMTAHNLNYVIKIMDLPMEYVPH